MQYEIYIIERNLDVYIFFSFSFLVWIEMGVRNWQIIGCYCEWWKMKGKHKKHPKLQLINHQHQFWALSCVWLGFCISNVSLNWFAFIRMSFSLILWVLSFRCITIKSKQSHETLFRKFITVFSPTTFINYFSSKTNWYKVICKHHLK